MSKTAYHIRLKGYVGGSDFDRNAVDEILKVNDGKAVNVLIDSLGGNLATGLSISTAFKHHGEVNVHFVGLNASAATIASLGASHISIDEGAMYLVHQCSMAFFEWGSLNADQFATLIADCEKIKADLDKLDMNVAQLYAARCKRKPEDLLALMKAGGWLSAKEALEWGFVDEITDLADEPAPKMTDALASAMASEGMPIPNIPLSESDRESAFGKFLSAIASLFRTPTNTISTIMNKSYTFICAVLGIQALTLTDKNASLSEEQLDSIEAVLAHKDKLINEQKEKLASKEDELSAKVSELTKKEEELKAKEEKIAELQAKLDAKPGDDSKQVVDNGSKADRSDAQTEAEVYVQTVNSARKLFNQV